MIGWLRRRAVARRQALVLEEIACRTWLARIHEQATP